MARLDRHTVMAAFSAALAAVEPGSATRHGLADLIAAGELDPTEAWVVVGIGKAAPRMAAAAVDVLGESDAIVVSDHSEEAWPSAIVGDHPIPGDRSFRAGASVTRFIDRAGHRPVLFLISGGGSALCEVPVDGVGFADIEAMNATLMRSGLDISQMNAIRASASAVKAGGLAERVAGRATTLVLSDVPGAGAEYVASGPSIASAIGSDAITVIDDHDLGAVLPSAVVAAARTWTPRQRRESDLVRVVASPAVAADAAAAFLRERGFDAVVGSSILGELASEVDATIRSAAAIVVRAGEAHLRVNGDGLGGRNQHAALVAASMIQGSEGVFGAFGTDGVDGPTDAAGAIVDGQTWERMLVAGLEPGDRVTSFDSHRALDGSGDLVRTGATGTNVADLWIFSR
jgi:glycerate 2-kinase